MDNIKHGKVEWSRLIGIPERKKVNGPLRARANFTFFTLLCVKDSNLCGHFEVLVTVQLLVTSLDLDTIPTSGKIQKSVRG